MVDMVPLEKVPLPGALETGRKCRYLWRTVQNGDSFFVPGRSTFSTAAWSKKTGFTYITRSVVEKGTMGVRIWRVAEPNDAQE